MQKLILILALLNTLTAYNLFYILKTAEIIIAKIDFSQNKKNWISMDIAGSFNYSSEHNIIDTSLVYKYKEDGLIKQTSWAQKYSIFKLDYFKQVQI
jgi:hypothetical protein